MGENALHPAVPTCLLLHHQGGGDLVSWAPVFSRTFWWEKYVKVWMELCIKTMSPRLETQWNTYIYIYIYIVFLWKDVESPSNPSNLSSMIPYDSPLQVLEIGSDLILEIGESLSLRTCFSLNDTHGCLWPLARFLTTASAYIAYHAYHFQHMKVTIYHKVVY